MKRIFTIALLVIAPWFTMPVGIVMAETPKQTEPPVNIGNPLDPKFGESNATTPTAPGEDTVATVQMQLGNLLGIMLRGIAALSLLPIVVGGFQMIISQGSEDKVARGKQTVYFGIVGLVLALLAIAFFQTFLSLVLNS